MVGSATECERVHLCMCQVGAAAALLLGQCDRSRGILGEALVVDSAVKDCS